MTLASERIYPLSLDDVSRLALTNNFDIQLTKYDIYIARTGEDSAESIYDTLLESGIGYRNNQRARTSTIAGTKSLENEYFVGLSKKLPTGTTINLDGSDLRSWSNSPFATLNPSHDAALEFSIEQELGKNFFGLKDRGNIKITKLDIENSEYTSLEKVEQYLGDVQKAYWDLVLQQEQIKLEQELVEQAKKLFDLHQEKIQDGLIELPELLASEANYRERITNLLSSRDQLATKENTLKLLLNITDDNVRLSAKESLLLRDEILAVDQSLKSAFDNRRDYKKAGNEIKAKNIKLEINKNNIWPEINLTASLERNGVARKLGNAFENVSSQDNPNFFTGVTVSFPLENRGAKSKLRASELEKAKAILNMKYLERKISIGIIDQVRGCNVLKETSVNRDRVAELQRQKLEAEQKRFNTGRSDTDTIIRFQDDVLKAEQTALQSKFAYYSALIDLQIKEGALLNKYWEGALEP
jgi:outer membrane protein TolC